MTKQAIKYDLGCGERKQPGFIGVDIAKLENVDIVYDLTQFPWKFAQTENTSEVYCSHFFEHLTGHQRMGFMDELYRILIPGGTVTIITPYYTSMRAVQDPTHAWPPVADMSYAYFNKKWREDNKLSHYPIHCDFDFETRYYLNDNFRTQDDAGQHFAINHYWNSAADLMAICTKNGSYNL